MQEASTLRAENRELIAQIQVSSDKARTANEKRSRLQGEIDENLQTMAGQIYLIEYQGNINLALKKELEVRSVIIP